MAARLSHFNANVCKLFNLRMAECTARPVIFFHPIVGVRSPCAFHCHEFRIIKWIAHSKRCERDSNRTVFSVYVFVSQPMSFFIQEDRLSWHTIKVYVYILASSKDGSPNTMPNDGNFSEYNLSRQKRVFRKIMTLFCYCDTMRGATHLSEQHHFGITFRIRNECETDMALVRQFKICTRFQCLNTFFFASFCCNKISA